LSVRSSSNVHSVVVCLGIAHFLTIPQCAFVGLSEYEDFDTVDGLGVRSVHFFWDDLSRGIFIAELFDVDPQEYEGDGLTESSSRSSPSVLGDDDDLSEYVGVFPAAFELVNLSSVEVWELFDDGRE